MKPQKNKSPQATAPRLKAFFPWIVLCFSFFLYSQSISFKYTLFDDDYLLMENKDFFTKDGDLKTIFTTDAFLKDDGNFYRPLQNVSFLMDVKIFGDMDMRMFHFTNILLFALIAFSLYFLLLRFNIPHFIAFMGTLVYAAHPLFTSSATWIPARGDLLLTLFSILAFIFWIRFLNHKKYGDLVTSWLCFTLALFTKETAALLPVLFLVYFFTFEPKPKIDFKMVLFGVFLLGAGVAWFILRSSFIQTYDTGLDIAMFLQNLFAIPVGLAMFAVPYDFSTAPEFTFIKISIGVALLMAIIVMTVVKNSQHRGKKFFYLLWFVLLLFPTFFAQTKEWDYLDHRFLLPLIGILLFILSFIQNIGKRKIAVVSTILIIIFSTASIFRSRAFSNPYAFCEALKHNKNHPESYYFVKGNLEHTAKKYESALQEYNTVIRYNPDHIRALNNRGMVKQKLGDLQGALADYNHAIELDFKNYHIFKNRGTVRFQLEDYAGAVEDCGSALEYEDNADIYYLRGMIYRALAENEKALADFNHYISRGYANPELYTQMGIIYGKTGDFENAIDCFSKALAMDAAYTSAYYNRAFAKYTLLDYSGALADCEKLLAIDSLYSNALILRAKILNAPLTKNREISQSPLL
jgi:tetratricopeptide (TPR) repeat protein